MDNITIILTVVLYISFGYMCIINDIINNIRNFYHYDDENIIIPKKYKICFKLSAIIMIVSVVSLIIYILFTNF